MFGFFFPQIETAHCRVAFYCDQSKAHLCHNHAVYSAPPYTTPVRWMDYLGKGEVLTNTDSDRIVYNIREKWSFVYTSAVPVGSMYSHRKVEA